MDFGKAVAAAVCLWAPAAQSLPQPSPQEPGAFEALIPPAIEPKLELGERQKSELAEIQKDFTRKHGEALRRLKEEASRTYEACQKARRASEDKEARRQHALYVDRCFEFRKLRDEFEPRIQALLDEKQRLTYGQLKGRIPGFDLHREGVLDVGDPAPDFSLSTVEGRGTVRLSEFKGRKPVVLVLGSFT